MRSSLLALVFLAACGGGESTPETPAETPADAKKAAAVEISDAQLGAFKPLPDTMPKESNPITPEKVELGRLLYYDARLSKNHDVSCNSCHQLDKFGVDGEPTSPGHKGVRGGRNSPTSYNAALHIAQFWDGRAADVEAQAKGPVLNPVEMAMPDEATVVSVLKSVPGYEAKFKAAFPDAADPITYDNMANAIGAFERKLVTPSPWDAFLKGDKDALTAEQKRGFIAFSEAGCVTCHSGVGMGGGMYMKLGLVEPWPNQADQGKFDQTGVEGDKMMFKVPSLRNIEKTGPYFHDGQTKELSTAVKMMAKHQLGKELTDEQATSITIFLGALTGTPDAEYIKEPEALPSGPNTPKPDPT